VAHPQANGQVERANALLLAGLKPQLYDQLKDYGGKWMDELPKVVLGLRTQQSRATEYSPFFLVYGSKAILPCGSDLELAKSRVVRGRLEIDSAEEKRLAALFQSARYLEGVRWHYLYRHYPLFVKERTSPFSSVQPGRENVDFALELILWLLPLTLLYV
jgi:hypothetical protein